MCSGWALRPGQPACVASTIRICLHYGNLDVLEDGYGINMLPLATFALERRTAMMIRANVLPQKGGEDSGNSQQMLSAACTRPSP